MRRRVLLVLVAASWLPTALDVRANSSMRAGVRAHARQSRPRFKPGEVVVQFQGEVKESQVAEAIFSAGGQKARKSSFGDRYVVTLGAGTSVEGAVGRLKALPGVEYAEPNYTVQAELVPNDPLFRYQWNFAENQLNAPLTWSIQEGSSSVVVAVIDTGIAFEDYGPYFKAPDWGSTVFVQGYDFVNLDAHANDDEGHGTHIASTIAEATDNAFGATGLAFKCALMPVKVLDDTGGGTLFDVAEGVDYARTFVDAQGGHPVKVMNLSLGSPDNGQVLSDAIARAFAAGIVLVAAAGNDAQPTVSYPAAYPGVIAVGATNFFKQRAYYSNYGPQISVVAPGGDVTQFDNDGEPDGILQITLDPASVSEGIFSDFIPLYLDGTSSATAHVSATAALLVTQGITDPTAVREAMESTALALEGAESSQTGHGLVQPAAALAGLGLNQ